jgi:hypothetical protein
MVAKRFIPRLILGLAIFMASATGRAYVTSAILEFSADDEVAFFLNGSPLGGRSEFGPFDFQVLSTADGTLPLELFRANEENTLGVENFDTEAGNMLVAYRLTVYHSDGDPVVIWSVPEQSKFLHLAKEEKSPLGWTEPNFDDSKWTQAIGVNKTGNWIDFPRLEDAAFANLLGVGYVPQLVHQHDAMCRGGDHNLFRSKFRFPNNPAKVEILLNPPKAVYGQPVSVRLIPGPDTTEISQFNMLAWLPNNLQLVNYSPGAQYDSALRRISWKTSNRDMHLGYEKMYAEKVISGGGWGAPEKVLGPPKAGKARHAHNVPGPLYEDGSNMAQGLEAWFKMAAPKVDFTRGIPKIQGVIFRTQMKMGGRTAQQHLETDKVMFNYSVDGRTKGVLKNDVNVARTTGEFPWIDGYYHASEDRKWTWDELKNLRVMYKAVQVSNRDKNLMANITCIVRYYYPNLVAPWFQAKVLEKNCAEIQIKTGVFRFGSNMTSSDPLTVAVNQDKCAPTPVPTAIPTPVPIAIIKPQPTSTPAPKGAPAVASSGLACLSVSPDPMDYGGAFISFCLKSGAKVSVTIYTETGQGKRRIAATEFRAADLNQIFFNGLDDNNVLLVPGRYLCELRAEKEGHFETRNTYFNMVRKRAKR